MLNRLWLSLERCFLFNVIRLFRIRRASERVARGFAIGMVVNFFPTFGFGVLISGAIARAIGGNVVAGVVGGATLAFAWPLLFYLNMRMGSLFVKPRVRIDEFGDVTEQTMEALLWGRAFTAGAILNSLLAGMVVYVLFRLLYAEVRPAVLAYFRRHAREHQRKFRRQKPTS
jgi:uncharacterized protein